MAATYARQVASEEIPPHWWRRLLLNLAAQPPLAGNGNRQARHPELLGFVPGGLRRAGGKRACARRRSSIRLRSLGVKRNIGTPAGKSPRKVRAKQKSKDKQKNLEAPAGESTATRIPATQRGVADGHAAMGALPLLAAMRRHGASTEIRDIFLCALTL